MVGIYKITNPKGRVYVGQSVNIEKRKKSYEKGHCIRQTRLYRSIIKYGFHTHKFEILEEGSIHELNRKERYWQDYYNVLSKQGLNCRLTYTWDKSGKMSKIAIKKRVDKQKKPVLQYSIEGVLVKEWNSLLEAKQGTGIQSIAACCQERTKSAGGFIWVYRRGNVLQKIQTENIRGTKSIYQYTKEGVFIKEWTSLKEAGTFLGIDRSDISTCCSGRQKTAGGFIWKYKTI